MLFSLGLSRKVLSIVVLICFVRVSLAADISTKILSPLEEKIGQAKILYYDFQFKKSEQLLNEVIESLQRIPTSPAVNHDLSEAYLRLALTQDAQSKPIQDSLYQCVVYEASRELDPSQFAPTIVAQFNKAKQKYLLAQNINSSNSKLALKSSDVKQKNESQAPGQKTKKPFYKTWPFFLIIGLVVAGGGAGAAIALSGGGGGGGASGPVTVGGTPQ